MKTKSIIEGLTILNRYYKDPDGYNNGAEHDIIYAFETDRPVSPEDVVRLVELGWSQHEVEPSDEGEGFRAVDYDPGEGWAAHV